MSFSNSTLVSSQPHPDDSLGKFLINTQRITPEAANRADAVQKTKIGESYTDILTNLGLISADELANGIAEFLNLPRYSAMQVYDAPSLPTNINFTFFKKHRVLPIALRESGALEVATVDPSNIYIQRALSFLHDGLLSFYVATAHEIEIGLENILASLRVAAEDEIAADISSDVERLRELASDAPVIKFVDHLIESALNRQASDIHLEPTEAELRCRLRVDGALEDIAPAPIAMAPAIVSRVKIMSGLDIAERRMPQDGRMRYRSSGREVDFRVATSPTASGESAVIRLLDKSQLSFKFSSLGFDERECAILDHALAHPHGIILVTGPTGSGKTTTLYAALTQLNQPNRKILTIEDPIEYVIEGVNQTQVEPKIGRSFAHMLRSFLRQDPDVIMVGEIRDKETAEIAIQAALTGHLVLSTLHTNDASSAITRLLDMGVAGYLISSTLRLVVAQRLVRKLCVSCHTAQAINLNAMLEIDMHFASQHQFYRAVGCQACGGTGYAGRTVIGECLEISGYITEQFREGVDAGQIEQSARKSGMQTMFENGINRAAAGQTTLEEVLRVTMRKQ